MVFGGGNALGAHFAGAYQQLAAQQSSPNWVIGALADAVTAPIVDANPL
jgi:predicted acylesterase/phospholipase RssA